MNTENRKFYKVHIIFQGKVIDVSGNLNCKILESGKPYQVIDLIFNIFDYEIEPKTITYQFYFSGEQIIKIVVPTEDRLDHSSIKKIVNDYLVTTLKDIAEMSKKIRVESVEDFNCIVDSLGFKL